MSVQNRILEVVKAAVSGDRVLGQRVVAQLARDLEGCGEAEQANEVRSLLKGSRTTFSLQRAAPAVDAASKKQLDYGDPTELADYFPVELMESEPPVLNDSVNKRILEFIQFINNAEKLKAAGLDISPSLLLYGPPGNGKTYTAKYVAQLLSLPLYTARCDTLVSSYLGSTSKNIRSLFEFASNQPCVLFLDEFDALAKARDDKHELGELKRVVVSLLQNIDVLPSTTILIAATNHENLLDSAVWRRFAYRLEVNKPEVIARQKIIARLLQDFSIIPELIEELAIITEGLSIAIIEQAIKSTMRHSLLNFDGNLDIAHLISGVFEVQGWIDFGKDENLEGIVKKLRELDSKTFTIRRIATLLGVSSAKVSRVK
jgi:MoxR-like ATPase